MSKLDPLWQNFLDPRMNMYLSKKQNKKGADQSARKRRLVCALTSEDGVSRVETHIATMLAPSYFTSIVLLPITVHCRRVWISDDIEIKQALGLVIHGDMCLIACGALAASICVGIVIPSTWLVYLYNILLSQRSCVSKTIHRLDNSPTASKT